MSKKNERIRGKIKGEYDRWHRRITEICCRVFLRRPGSREWMDAHVKRVRLTNRNKFASAKIRRTIRRVKLMEDKFNIPSNENHSLYTGKHEMLIEWHKDNPSSPYYLNLMQVRGIYDRLAKKYRWQNNVKEE
jgi:hypothetical protein